MKIRMKENAEHRISSAKSQTFIKGETYENVAKKTAEKLIEAGKAEEITGTTGAKPASKE